MTDEPIEATAHEAEPDPTPEPAAPPREPEVPDERPAAVEPAVEPAVAPLASAVGLAEGLPIVPSESEFTRLARMAVTLAAAAAVPAALRNRPNDVFLVLYTGRDIGISLTTALREIHIIDGKPTISPKLKLALVRQHGAGKVYPHQAPRRTFGPEGEERWVLCPCGSDAPANGAEEATWHAERPDEPGIIHTSTFTMADAEAANLTRKDNWRSYPARMLSWRARGYLLDDVFSEVGTGLYSPDEMGAVTDADGEPIEVAAVEAPTGLGPRRPTNGPGAVGAPSAEAVEELTARLAAVKEVPAAHEELRAWWAEQSLPPLGRLSRGQAAKVAARLNALETRHEIPEPSDSAEDGFAPDASPAAPETVEEPATPDEEALSALAVLREEGSIVEWLIGRARLMSAENVRAWGAEQGLAVPDGNLAGLQRWWCEQEVERHLAGVLAALRLAFYGPLGR